MSAADRSTTSSYLSWLHAHAIAADVPGYVVTSWIEDGRWSSTSHALDALADAADEAHARCEAGLNVYARCHLVAEPISGSRRGGARDSRWVTHLAADVDVAGPGHASANLPPTVEAAVELVDATLAPSLIVGSGGGIYPVWRLAEPVELVDDDDRRRVKGIGHRLDAALASHGFHVDAVTSDLSRVNRPAGLTNRKPKRDARPVTVLRGAAFGAGDFTLDQLDAVLPKIEPKPPRRPPSATAGPRPAATDTTAPWEIFAQRYTVDDVLAADPVHSWHRVADQSNGAGEMVPAWLVSGSTSPYSIKEVRPGVVLVWSDTVAARLGITSGEALDLFGFACRLAGRDATTAAQGAAA